MENKKPENNKLKEKKLEMVVSGSEESNEEIVWNNLLMYMDEKKLDSEKKIIYLKKTILSIQYEKKKNKFLALFTGIPTLIGSLGITGAYFNGNHSLAANLAIATGAIALIGVGIKLTPTNPYNKKTIAFSDVKQQEKVYRKVAPFIK